MERQKIKEKFKREEKTIPKLKFGILHSHVGFEDGVSIVMRQLEEVITKELGADKKNIFYLVGKSKKQQENITVNELFDFDKEINQIMQTNYEIGFTKQQTEKIESAIEEARIIIKKFIDENKLDILIAHNLSHPVNFIMALALSRYYTKEINQGNKTPKYMLWWHDSHAERIQFENPAPEVKKYIKEGIPGGNVEYIAFINTGQFNHVEEYFLSIDRVKRGFYDKIKKNHDTIYNTTDIVIDEFSEIYSEKIKKKKETFFEDFKIKELFEKNKIETEEVIFCLQHTRMVKRKKIDFALEFAYKLLKKAKEEGKYKALYFLITGNNSDGSKEILIELNKKLQKEYKEKKVFLEFVENYMEEYSDEKKTSLDFGDYPLIFNNLGGITTYFSAIEGFGNNLLEVLAAGFTPIIYQYPVYKSDIAKFHFKVLSCEKFIVKDSLINETIELLQDKKLREQNGNRNIKLIKNHFSNASISEKLKKAILSKRTHWRKKSENQ